MPYDHFIDYDPNSDADTIRRILLQKPQNNLVSDMLRYSGSACWLIIAAVVVGAGISKLNKTKAGQEIHTKRKELQADIFEKAKSLLALKNERIKTRFDDATDSILNNTTINDNTINVNASNLDNLADLLEQEVHPTPQMIKQFTEPNNIAGNYKFKINLDTPEVLLNKFHFYNEYLEKKKSNIIQQHAPNQR